MLRFQKVTKYFNGRTHARYLQDNTTNIWCHGSWKLIEQQQQRNSLDSWADRLKYIKRRHFNDLHFNTHYIVMLK